MWGTVFCCFLRLLHDSLATENDCSGNDGAGKLFWGIKNLSSCYFLVAIKFFSHFIDKCRNTIASLCSMHFSYCLGQTVQTGQ